MEKQKAEKEMTMLAGDKGSLNGDPYANSGSGSGTGMVADGA
jgi:hypothetical protein